MIRLKVRQKNNGMLLHELTIARLPFRIGRGDGCDLVLSEKTVSRQHVEIRASREGSIEVINLSSSNGLYVNGAKLTSFTAREHSEFRISCYVIELDLGQEEVTEPVAPPPRAPRSTQTPTPAPGPLSEPAPAPARAPSGFAPIEADEDPSVAGAAFDAPAEAFAELHAPNQPAENLDEAVAASAHAHEAVFEADPHADELSLDLPAPRRELPRGLARLRERFGELLVKLVHELEANEPESFRRTAVIAATAGVISGASGWSSGKSTMDAVVMVVVAEVFAFGIGAILGQVSQRTRGDLQRKPLFRLGAATVFIYSAKNALLIGLGLTDPANPFAVVLDAVGNAAVLAFLMNFGWRRVREVPDEVKFRRIVTYSSVLLFVLLLSTGQRGESSSPTGFKLETGKVSSARFFNLSADRSLKELQASLQRSFQKVRAPAADPARKGAR